MSFFRNDIHMMNEDCELCYSCDYFKRIPQMAARYMLIDCSKVQCSILLRKWTIIIFVSLLLPRALHAMQTRSSDEKASVCPSVRPSVCLYVCPSVKRVDCDETKEISLQIFIRKNIQPSFPRRMVGGGRPLLPKILGQPAPVLAKSPILSLR